LKLLINYSPDVQAPSRFCRFLKQGECQNWPSRTLSILFDIFRGISAKPAFWLNDRQSAQKLFRKKTAAVSRPEMIGAALAQLA
jgi:hypothetical protein